MEMVLKKDYHEVVTFRKEGVDWNSPPIKEGNVCIVTFRKEGVDWN